VPRKRIDRKDKKCHLDFVWLSESEYAHLCELLGRDATEKWIDELNLYIGSKGDKYQSHYYTIMMWARRAKRSAECGVRNKSKTQAEMAVELVIEALKHPRHQAMPEFTPQAHRAAYTALLRMGLSWPELRRRIPENPDHLAEFREVFLRAYVEGEEAEKERFLLARDGHG
jgi:hypothetical protein